MKASMRVKIRASDRDLRDRVMEHENREYGAAPELGGGGNGRSPRKPPPTSGIVRARFPLAKIRSRELVVNVCRRYCVLIPLPPERPVIYDAKRRDQTKIVEPYSEGSDVTLICEWKQEYLDKTHWPTPTSDTFPKCQHLGATSRRESNPYRRGESCVHKPRNASRRHRFVLKFCVLGDNSDSCVEVLADSEVIRDGASFTGKRNWGKIGKEAAMAFVRDPSKLSPGVISENRNQDGRTANRTRGPPVCESKTFSANICACSDLPSPTYDLVSDVSFPDSTNGNPHNSVCGRSICGCHYVLHRPCSYLDRRHKGLLFTTDLPLKVLEDSSKRNMSWHGLKLRFAGMNGVALCECCLPAKGEDVIGREIHISGWMAVSSLEVFSESLIADVISTDIARYDLTLFLTSSSPGQWLECSTPTKANRIRFPEGSLPDFRTWESCRTIAAVGRVFSGTSRFPALAFRRLFMLTLLHTHRLLKPLFKSHRYLSNLSPSLLPLTLSIPPLSLSSYSRSVTSDEALIVRIHAVAEILSVAHNQAPLTCEPIFALPGHDSPVGCNMLLCNAVAAFVCMMHDTWHYDTTSRTVGTEMFKMPSISTNTCINPPCYGHPDELINPWISPDYFATRHNTVTEGAHIVYWGGIHHIERKRLRTYIRITFLHPPYARNVSPKYCHAILEQHVYTLAAATPPLASGVVSAFDRAAKDSTTPTMYLRDSYMLQPIKRTGRVHSALNCIESGNIFAKYHSLALPIVVEPLVSDMHGFVKFSNRSQSCVT
ncbi:hypothetical protein PR048_025396 [Dryococelus australis]|uniref:Uncharacterized protein n=1 Tax=Dryococelus australis TaxID=614101 RepID=A0ABQ9GRB2_9NEOP|nr:hypothetical protein PR048_025396 [Dryococelus australis]